MEQLTVDTITLIFSNLSYIDRLAWSRTCRFIRTIFQQCYPDAITVLKEEFRWLDLDCSMIEALMNAGECLLYGPNLSALLYRKLNFREKEFVVIHFLRDPLSQEYLPNIHPTIFSLDLDIEINPEGHLWSRFQYLRTKDSNVCRYHHQTIPYPVKNIYDYYLRDDLNPFPVIMDSRRIYLQDDFQTRPRTIYIDRMIYHHIRRIWPSFVNLSPEELDDPTVDRLNQIYQEIVDGYDKLLRKCANMNRLYGLNIRTIPSTQPNYIDFFYIWSKCLSDYHLILPNQFDDRWGYYKQLRKRQKNHSLYRIYPTDYEYELRFLNIIVPNNTKDQPTYQGPFDLVQIRDHLMNIRPKVPLVPIQPRSGFNALRTSLCGYK